MIHGQHKVCGVRDVLFSYRGCETVWRLQSPFKHHSFVTIPHTGNTVSWHVPCIFLGATLSECQSAWTWDLRSQLAGLRWALQASRPSHALSWPWVWMLQRLSWCFHWDFTQTESKALWMFPVPPLPHSPIRHKGWGVGRRRDVNGKSEVHVICHCACVHNWAHLIIGIDFGGAAGIHVPMYVHVCKFSFHSFIHFGLTPSFFPK